MASIRRLFPVLVTLALLLFPSGANALTCNSATGANNWNTVGTWSCGRVPLNVDDVVIVNNSTVNVNIAGAVAQSLVINGGNATSTLNFNAGSSLTVTNNVTINAPAGAVLKQITLGTSTLTVTTGNVSMTAGTGNNSFAQITITSGALNINTGTLSITGGTANNSTGRVTVTSGTVTVQGNTTLTGGSSNARDALLTVDTGTITISGGLTINSTVAASTTASITPGAGQIIVNGAAGVANGDTVSVGAGTFSVTNAAATFTNSNGAIAASTTVATGLLSVAGNLSNATGETVSLTGAGTITVGGTLTNDGTVTAATGTVNAGTFTNNNVVTVSSGLINVTGAYTNTAAGDTITISNAAGRLTVGGTLTNGGTITFTAAGTVTVLGTLINNGTVTAATGTVNADAFTNNNVVTVSTGVIRTTSNYANTAAGDTITISNAAGRLTVGGTLTNGGTITFSGAGTVNADGDFTSSGTVTNTAAGTINIKGNGTVNGTFTAGAGTVVLNGGAAQNLSGTALTFANFQINNASGVTLGNNLSVSATLTFSSGTITTGANRVILGTAGTVATPSATSYVVGTVQKNYSAAGTLTFPVGDASNYTPVTIQGTAGFTAGNLTITTTANDQPQVTTPVATTSIDAAKSVNRFWTLTASGLPATSTYNATFNYISGSPVDLDAGVTAGNFIVQYYDGTNWNPTVLSGTPTTTSAVITGATEFGDFAIGEPLVSGLSGTPGQFNAFDISTPAGSVIGFIQTKQAGVSFSLRLVRLNAPRNAVNTAYNQAGVTVELLDSSDNTGAMNGATACRPIGAGAGNWQVITGTTQTVTFASGVVTASFTVPNSYRDVRVHVVKTGGGAGEGCSTDRFAIRPQSLTISGHDANWETAGTARTLDNASASGGNVHKASTSAAATPRPFTLRATPVPGTATNYDGSPTVVSSFPACGTLCTTLGIFSFTGGSWTGTGVRENATANYSEAGTFSLRFEDTAYASVDTSDGTPAATRTVPATATAEIGRFVPERFEFASPSTPNFATFNSDFATCGTRSFTYIGQPFWFATGMLPTATLNAVNAAGAVTTNYPLDTAPATGRPALSETYADSTAPPSAPLDTALVGTPATITGAGTGTYSAAAGGQLGYFRNTTAGSAIGPFNATISLTVTASDSTESAVSGNGTISATSLVFNGGGSGIAFDGGGDFNAGAGLTGGKTLVYGRMRVGNASGSQLVPLIVQMETQYYSGAPANTFNTNSADSCTSIASADVAMGSYTNNLTDTPSCETAVSGGGRFSSGRKTLLLAAPGSGNNGSVTLTVNLGSSASGNTCPTVGADPLLNPATTSNRPYLQGNWTTLTFTQNPTGRATFGVYRGSDEIIDIRENFLP